MLHVLMTEYRYALVRNGHRRIDIDKLCASAQKRLEQERSYPTGKRVSNHAVVRFHAHML